MKSLYAAWLLAWTAGSVIAADATPATLVESHSPHAFDISDLVMMDRVSDPQLSVDGRYAAFSVRSTDYAANKGVNAIYVQALDAAGEQPLKVVPKGTSSPRLRGELRSSGVWIFRPTSVA
jgi:hypothetical protein